MEPVLIGALVIAGGALLLRRRDELGAVGARGGGTASSRATPAALTIMPVVLVEVRSPPKQCEVILTRRAGRKLPQANSAYNVETNALGKGVIQHVLPGTYDVQVNRKIGDRWFSHQHPPTVIPHGVISVRLIIAGMGRRGAEMF